ncbi:hypothetical protein ACTMTJ_34950 [Phytohabitans sp. LJ34]|uniref:hypothetical protein n=1 Tax=Phytohabitans sp. LJ34 TaxID=3452217 RepID=UPI003F8B4BB5
MSPAAVNTLASTAWVREGSPLCLIGDSGTGKSHLLIGIWHRGRRGPAEGQVHDHREPGQRARRGC